MNNMKRSVFAASLVLAILSLFALPASAQIVTLTSTTTTAAVASTDKYVCLASATNVNAPGVGTTGSTIFFADGASESMIVRAVNSSSVLCFDVVRSNRPVGHASGATVYVGYGYQFYSYAPIGTCVLASMQYRPWINLNAPPGEASIYDCVSSFWTAINGAATQGTGLTTLGPNAAGTVDNGSATLPWRYLYMAGTSGTPATNNFKFAGASTSGTRIITLPDAAITVSGAKTYNGGTTSTYTATSLGPNVIIHSGSAPLVSTGTASPVTVASFSPAFTSATSYVCTASPVGGTAGIAAGGIAITQSSATQVVFTGPASVSTVINFICIGN